jgi:hypothetical protein
VSEFDEAHAARLQQALKINPHARDARERDEAYIARLQLALRVNPHARAFYFPPDRAERLERNRRLGREIGFGLSDDADLGGLYSRLVVTFSFDSTGVAIDNAAFLDEVRAGQARARGGGPRSSDGGSHAHSD